MDNIPNGNKKAKEHLNIIFNNKINNIVFYSVDIEIETPFNIQCNNFLNSFSDIDSVSINKPLYIDDFINELKRMNLNDNNDCSTVDTRYIAKIQYKNGSDEILCGDKFEIVFRNKKFKASPNIISKIYTYTVNALKVTP